MAGEKDAAVITDERKDDRMWWVPSDLLNDGEDACLTDEVDEPALYPVPVGLP